MGGYARAGEEIPREANAKKGTTAAPLKQRGGSNGLAKGKTLKRRRADTIRIVRGKTPSRRREKGRESGTDVS